MARDRETGSSWSSSDRVDPRARPSAPRLQRRLVLGLSPPSVPRDVKDDSPEKAAGGSCHPGRMSPDHHLQGWSRGHHQ